MERGDENKKGEEGTGLSYSVAGIVIRRRARAGR